MSKRRVTAEDNSRKRTTRGGKKRADQLIFQVGKDIRDITYSASSMCFWNSESGPSLSDVTTYSHPFSAQYGPNPRAL